MSRPAGEGGATKRKSQPNDTGHLTASPPPPPQPCPAPFGIARIVTKAAGRYRPDPDGEWGAIVPVRDRSATCEILLPGSQIDRSTGGYAWATRRPSSAPKPSHSPPARGGRSNFTTTLSDGYWARPPAVSGRLALASAYARLAS